MKQGLIALHRYWMWANRMREEFFKALDKMKTEGGTEDSALFADDSGIFMSYWYAGLFVVVEGWKELGVNDPEIDTLLASPNVDVLKRYRHGVCHFQKNYFDNRFADMWRDSKSTVPWVRQLNAAFGKYFLETLQSEEEDKNEKAGS